jgi:hypothetical protein
MAFWRGHWFVSSVFEIRIIWNMTTLEHIGRIHSEKPRIMVRWKHGMKLIVDYYRCKIPEEKQTPSHLLGK